MFVICLDFSRRYALQMISGGMAILDAYNEFIQSNGNLDSLFFRYAMGDVQTELNLYKKLKQLSLDALV